MSDRPRDWYINPDDIVGQKFGSLTVESFYKKIGKACNDRIYYKYLYKCKCDCGNHCIKVRGALLYPKNNDFSKLNCGDKFNHTNFIKDINDIIGKRVGQLEVLSYDHYEVMYKDESKVYFYKCLCHDCGTECLVRRGSLLQATQIRCHDCAKKYAIEAAKEDPNDIVGSIFGGLKILKLHENNANNSKCIYECQCLKCGKIVYKTRYFFKRKTSYLDDCGCVAERSKLIRSQDNLYSKWCDMKKRCYNPNSVKYYRYGGRGIVVCDRWKNSFENFYDDLHDSYVEHVKQYGEKDTTLDRINNNGNYEPDNVRWATQKEQSMNRSTNTYVTICGQTYLFEEAVNRFGAQGVSIKTAKQRYYRFGYSAFDAITKPLLGSEVKSPFISVDDSKNNIHKGY